MLMKIKGFLSIMAAALMLSLSFTSCDDLDGLFDDDENESSADGAFFPSTYSQRKVAAWYSLTDTKDNGTRVEAVFLFEDGSFVTTKCKTYTDGRSQERKILAEGDYKLTGDYENGTAEVKINGAPEPMTVEIKDGKMLAMGETFTKQSNKKVPKATEPTPDGGDDHGGDNHGGDLAAFFPTAYAGKSVSAWFASAGTEGADGYEIKYVASVYFFEDNTFIATSNMVISGPMGQSTERVISEEGKYRILEGDFNTGKVSLMYGENKSMTVDIVNGQISILDTDSGQTAVYTKQDNAKVPQPTDPTDNGHPGGPDNPGGDDQNNGVPAFFPTAFADKTVVAWYSYYESISVQTMVEAIFLFDDGTLVVTEHKVFAQEIQLNPERYILASGTYSLNGDYDNGTANIMLDQQGKLSAYINNGKLTIDINNFTYTRRELKDVPQPLDPTDGGQQGGDDNPQGGDGAGLAAWYTQTLEMNGREYTVAIILLDNNVIAITRTAAPDGSGNIAMTEIMGIGTYQILDGDLTNGKVLVTMFGEDSEYIITDGVVTGGDGAELEGNYTKQDNSLYDGPTDYSPSGDDDGDDDGDDEGDDDFDESLLKAYLPADFASKEIAAWYMFADEESNTGRIEAVFLFTDNTLIVTKTKVYSKSDGRKPEYSITAYGQYRITEGDYTTGKASVMTEDGRTFDVVIDTGVLTAMETEFVMIPNELISIMTTNGK